MTTIVFSHGNSFPASTYRVMLDSLRARGFTITHDALERRARSRIQGRVGAHA